MKLEKWPEEVECDGWKWRRKQLPMTDTSKDMKDWVWWNMYEPIEKLYVPPTMKEIMDHLVKGGWVKVTYEYFPDGAIYVRLKADGKGTEYFDTTEREKGWQGHNTDALFRGNNGKKELTWKSDT